MSIINDSHIMYSSWDMECIRQIFFSFWTIFWPFYHPPSSPHLNNLKNQNLEKLKKTPEDIIILHVYHEWQPYDVWLLTYRAQRTDFFVKKIKILKNWKKNTKRYYHFTQVCQKSWSYPILFLRYGTWQINCYFSFWAIFCPFTSLTAQKIKISKKKKNKAGDIIILHIRTKNYD